MITVDESRRRPVGDDVAEVAYTAQRSVRVYGGVATVNFSTMDSYSNGHVSNSSFVSLLTYTMFSSAFTTVHLPYVSDCRPSMIALALAANCVAIAFHAGTCPPIGSFGAAEVGPVQGNGILHANVRSDT